MHYKSKEEQVQLIQQILAARDDAEDEERIPGEGRGAGPWGAFGRRSANLGSLSGADDAVYREYRKNANSANKHPLFKKFRQK